MEKAKLGKTDLYVSPICYGTWEIGGMPFFRTPDKSDAIRAIDVAIDIGINFIDTAPVYGFGRSEEILGEALQGKDVIVATKCGLYWTSDDPDTIDVDNSSVFIRKDIEGSLRRLRRETIDLYQVHWPEFEKKTPLEETIDVLEQLKQEGKIRFYGISNFTYGGLAEMTSYGNVSTLQNRHSILTAGSRELDFCQKHNIAFLAYSPLHRGLLTDRFMDDFSSSKDLMVKRIAGEEGYDYNREKARQLYQIAQEYGISLSVLALNHLIKNIGVNVAIVGSKNPKHITQLENIFETDIKPEDIGGIL